MNQPEFERNMRGAKALQTIASDFPNDNGQDFWQGYQRGMRRHYHGEKFGTEQEHARWMLLADEYRDIARRFRGLGYWAGFDGMSVDTAINYLAKFTAASAAGSVRSEAKTLAARENAKRPRPNAQGKPKPRKTKEPSA